MRRISENATTIREWMTKQLTDCALWPAEAAHVIEAYIESEAGEAMTARLSNDMEDYPPQLAAIIWLGLKATALEWIDENAPKHFARAMLSE